MRENYLIRLVDDKNCETEIRLHATRYQVDKVFYALAFASNDGSYRFGELLLNGKVKQYLRRFDIKKKDF